MQSETEKTINKFSGPQRMIRMHNMQKSSVLATNYI